MKAATHTWFMIGRQLRNLMREPIWIVMMLIQPMIWLLLYGQLFSRISALRGGAGSYVEFLAPGVVVMNAFFGATWSGMATIQDLDRSVIDRFLATPASRLALVLSQIVRSGLTAIIQALIILGVGYALGVRVHGGFPGWLATFAAAFLLATAFAGISQGIALLVRKDATMIAVAELHRAAADVPVDDPDQPERDADLDAVGRELEPRQLGRQGGPGRNRPRRQLERRAGAPRAACSRSPR